MARKKKKRTQGSKIAARARSREVRGDSRNPNGNGSPNANAKSSGGEQNRVVAAALWGCFLFILAAGFYILQPLLLPGDDPVGEAEATMKPTRFFKSGNLTIAWDSISPKSLNLVSTPTKSNIAPNDYVGDATCVDCHQENHREWSQHPHRWMNALATEEAVIGDFSGDKSIEYLGGVGTFYREGADYRMKYEKAGLTREYRITQTIGSRFYQYYVGVGIVGPESKEHPFFSQDFVLPFGFWIERKEWVPIVHVAEELDENHRWETVNQLTPPQEYLESMEEVSAARGVSIPGEELGLVYASACNYCHTTFALGDMFVRMPQLIGQSLTEDSYLELSQYVAKSHPVEYDGSFPPEEFTSDQLAEMTDEFIGFDARDKARNLGVSCEACHLGCREHVEAPESVMPSFAPQHPNFHSQRALDTGRTAANVNAACARCHVGDRPKYAAGMATWNSTEYSDAMKGGCYSQLTCVHCHDPHQATGLTWSKSPHQDDESCLACHEQFKEPDFRKSHTHHPAGTAGDRCMNCHMPKINEGMQDVVRTHTIFSPTDTSMIEANQPNACNLCHLDKSIEWTLDKLKLWYDRDYDSAKISEAYADTTEAVGRGWIKQKHQATRLVAFEALGKSELPWAAEVLVSGLDDPFLLNRQFAQTALEERLNTDLAEEFRYWFYHQPETRRPIVSKIREYLGRASSSGPSEP